MELSAEIEAALLELSAEWNKAEGAIKLAEQVNGEIINPAIYELRYGGRRVVEALALVAKGNSDEALLLLRDAHFDCCRSRHDAIDAATSKIVSDLEIAMTKLGPEAVLQSFPEFPNLFAQLGEVRDKIAASRQNRDQRDAIYATIEGVDLPGLVQSYRRFRANESVMK